MKISLILAMAAAAIAISSAAEAASVTIDFPTAGDFWGEIAAGESGFLAAGDYTDPLSSQYSWITSTGNSYPSLNNFVATSFSVTMNISTGPDTIAYGIDGESVDVWLPDCCGTELYSTGTLTLPRPIRLFSTSQISFTLLYDVGQPSPPNFIEFGTGTVTINGAYATPEPSTWAMMLLGFAGLGFGGYRKVKGAAA
ncbi:MAG TPA: PEP-CTERM sorting domain-containing protein [Roseiarcus sp.]